MSSRNSDSRTRSALVVAGLGVLAAAAIALWPSGEAWLGATVDAVDASAFGIDVTRAGECPSPSEARKVVVDGAEVPEVTKTLVVRVIEQESGRPCVGFRVASRWIANDATDEGVLRARLVEGWSRLLVSDDRIVVGVPIPLFVAAISTVRDSHDTHATQVHAQEVLTDAAGIAVIEYAAGRRPTMVEVRDQDYTTFARLHPTEDSLTVVVAARVQHVYRLHLPPGAPDRPRQMLSVHRSSAAVVTLSSRDGVTFVGPSPVEWVPFLLPSSGLALREPVLLDRGAAATELACVKLDRLEVVDAVEARPVPSVFAITLDHESRRTLEVRRSFAADGAHHMPSFSNACRLLCADGFVSAYCEVGVERVVLQRGGDAEFDVMCSEESLRFDFDMVLLPPSTTSTDPASDTFLSTRMHRGGASRHAAPAGRYLLRPKDPAVASAVVDLVPGRLARVWVTRAETMVVRHAPGLRLTAVDRLGRRVTVGSSDDAEESVFEGLVDGPILVGASHAPGSEELFLLGPNARMFDFAVAVRDTERSLQSVFVSPGWTIRGLTSEGGVHTLPAGGPVLFEHANGVVGNCCWQSGDSPVVLPAEFRRLRIEGVHATMDPRRGDASFLGGKLALRLRWSGEPDGSTLLVPSDVAGVVLFDRAAERHALCLPYGANAVSFPGSRAPTQFRRESLRVAPRGGLHVVVMHGTQCGEVADSLFTTRAQVWNVRVPAGSLEGWFVVTITDASIAREPLEATLARGFIVAN